MQKVPTTQKSSVVYGTFILKRRAWKVPKFLQVRLVGED